MCVCVTCSEFQWAKKMGGVCVCVCVTCSGTITGHRSPQREGREREKEKEKGEREIIMWLWNVGMWGMWEEEADNHLTWSHSHSHSL